MKLNEIYNLLVAKRNFITEEYVQDKLEALKWFFKSSHINSVVLGVSGGIDSAVVLLLLDRLSKMEDSPLELIYALNMPIHSGGTTDQHMATDYANLLYDTLKDNPKIKYELVDMSEISEAYAHKFINPNNWMMGQLASLIREPMVYSKAAWLQQEGYRSLTCGTINRDEGAYIGYYGKGSDAMVDIQFIGDIHKSEVYKIAKYLNCPAEIIDATPKGDVFDGRSDLEMIGAPYWFVELYTLLKEDALSAVDLIEQLEGEDLNLYREYAINIEKIHLTNAHKYMVGYPSHFIDCMKRKVPGGW